MGVFTVNTTDGYDYNYDLAAFRLQEVRENSQERIRESIQEAEILLEAYMDITMEAGVVGTAAKAPAAIAKTANKTVNGISNGAKAVGNTAKKAGTKVKDIINRIIEFFKNLYKRFVDNMQTWFQNSGKWLEARKEDFSKFDYTEMSTEMVPYWEGKLDTSFKVSTNKIMDSLRFVFASASSVDDFLQIENYQQKYLKEYFDRSNDLKEGLKNYYRVNVAAGKDRVAIKGQTLRNLVNSTFIPTILNYQKYVNDADTQLKNINNKLNATAADLDRRDITTESALFQDSFENTDFYMHEELKAVLEAETAVANKTTKREDPNAKDSASNDNTKVELNRDKRSAAQKADDDDNSNFKTNVQGKNNNQVRALNNILSSQQLMVTSYLTVMEERYTVYMNALKAIWQASNTVGGRNKDTNNEPDTANNKENKK